MPHSSLVRWLCRVYRLLLHAYPPDLRLRFGAEMTQVFADRCRDLARSKGIGGLLNFGAHSAADWLISALRERFAAVRIPSELTGCALPAVDGMPTFYTSPNYSPGRNALFNGAIVSVGIFMGLYLAMSHWTAHALSSASTVGSHYESRSHILEVRTPSAAAADLNAEIKVKPQRGRPRDVWSRMVGLLSSSVALSPIPGPAKSAGGRASSVKTDSGKFSPGTGVKRQSIPDDSGLLTRLRVSVSSLAASLSRSSGSSSLPMAGHPPAAAESLAQSEEYEEWDDPRSGFPAAYFRSILVLGALDADHDGIISPLEIANAPGALRSLDRNHDGKLTAEECGGVDDRAGTEFMRLNPVLAALDTNHDGEISASEIRNASTALKALDRDGDGKLAQNEVLPDPLANALGLIMRLDADGDGRISSKERSSPLADRYRDFLDAADRNDDGVVTQEELANELRRRAALNGISVR